MSRYVPRPLPLDQSQLGSFMTQELANLARALSEQHQTLNLAVSYAAPSKVFDGLIVLADGTKWDPGSGGGFYGYRAGAWRFLG